MFGRKTEERPEPIKLYSATEIKEIQNCFKGNTEYELNKVDFNKVQQINIDLVTLLIETVNGNIEIDYKVNTTVDKDYYKAWMHGPGRFIKKDIRLQQNLFKYAIISYVGSNKVKMKAFIRFVTPDEFEDESVWQDMQDYKAVNFKLDNTINMDFDFDDTQYGPETYVSVMKIFRENAMSDEFNIGVSKRFKVSPHVEEEPASNIMTVPTEEQEESEKIENEPLFNLPF